MVEGAIYRLRTGSPGVSAAGVRTVSDGLERNHHWHLGRGPDPFGSTVRRPWWDRLEAVGSTIA